MGYIFECKVNVPITVGSVAAISGLVMGAMWYRKHLKNQPPKAWVKVGQVEELCIYPVKSFKGLKPPTFECTPLGPKLGSMRDRGFVVVDKDGKFVTGRNYPKMTQITPKISGTVITLTSPDTPQEVQLDLNNIEGATKKVLIWGTWTEGIDCGDEVASWLSMRILGEESGLRLLFCGMEERGKQPNDNIIAYSKMVDVQLQKSDGGSFSDGAAYHLISQASIRELNSRLEGAEVSALNFRPNFVIKGESLLPFEEDNWKWVKIGDVVFRCISLCSRCLFTTIDPSTGEKSEKAEPLSSLRRYRNVREEAKKKVFTTPIMGIYLGPSTLGKVNVGDEVCIPQI